MIMNKTIIMLAAVIHWAAICCACLTADGFGAECHAIEAQSRQKE